MRVVYDDLWFCQDCLFSQVNGKPHDRPADYELGMQRLGAHVVPNFDSETEEGILEFSRRPCQCCNSHLAGPRHRFAILGE